LYDSSSQARKGLERLKWALVLLAIGGLLELAPVIQTIGELLAFIGLILAILAWWALGKSMLPNAERYHNTALVFIFTFIIVFVGAIIGIFAIVFSVISSNPSNPASFAAAAATETVELVIVLSVFSLFSQLFSAFSLRRLSKDLSQPDFWRSGNLFIFAQAVGVLTLAGLVVLLQSGAFTSIIESAFTNQTNAQISVYSLMFTGQYAVLGIISAAGTVLGLLAMYYGYRGASKGLDAQILTAPPMPPAAEGTVFLGNCQFCGAQIESAAADFCLKCGKPISR
jgi:uncharacterized membrane protein